MKSVVIFFVVIFLCSGVFAVYGVAPRSYEINFKPNLNKTFNFKFILGKSSENLRVEGTLAKYVSLNKKRISGIETVVAKLNLPSNISDFGLNQIYIVAGAVVGAIKINVPYPDKFVKLELNVPNANVGQDVKISLRISNVGQEPVYANSSIKVYKGKKLVKIFKGKFNRIDVSDSLKYDVSIQTSNYSAGDYNVVAMANYGKKSATVNHPFHLGELSVRILNYTNKFYKNRIEKFEIYVESLDNENIKKIYAEVRVVDDVHNGFDTTPVKLRAWGNKTLDGFFNTGGIAGKNVSLNITLHYDGRSSSKIVGVEIIKGFDYVFYGIILVVLIVVAILVWMGFIFAKSFKNKSNK